MRQGRGQLTDRVLDLSRELLGREITRTELRLLPYLQFTMMNSQRIDPIKIDGDEMKVLSLWAEEGHLLDGVTSCGRPKISEGEKIVITEEFWSIMNEILFLSYVDLYEE